jgi:hypothetical protein
VSIVDGDDDLLIELRALFTRLDPMARQVLDQAHVVYCWRSVDSELAELSFDSLVDENLMLAVRAGGDPGDRPRMLGFGAVVDGEDVAIDVEVTAGPNGPALVGQLSPPEATTVQLHAGTGEVDTVQADELGRFLIEPVPGGPVRLRVQHGDRHVDTTWVSYVRP